MKIVLIVDASVPDNRVMSGLLVKAGYTPVVSESIDAAKEEVAKLPPGAVIVAAMKFRNGTAQELINWQKRMGYKFPVIAIVENLNGIDVVEVMKDGGAVNVIQRAAIDKQLVEAVSKYAIDIADVSNLSSTWIQRTSANFQEIQEAIRKIAKFNSNCIIFGESGMGKEQVAREIYRLSGRTDKPLSVIEAGGAALVGKHDPTTLQSEVYNRIEGYFQEAKGGTIILKNVHLLNFEKQSVLLYILSVEHPEVMVICTAEPELLNMVSEHKFRANLFYHLRNMDVTIQPLRKVPEDIQPIADFFLKMVADEKKEPVKRLDASAVKALKQHRWPGNIRELKSVIIVAVNHTGGNVITASDLIISKSSPDTPDTLKLRDPKMEKRIIEEALAQTSGNITQAAKLLGIHPKTLSYKMKQYGLK